MKKVITTENGQITFKGNNQWREIEYDIDKKEDEALAYFTYKKDKYYLNEILRTDKMEILKDYDGYMNYTYFNGLAVKFNERNDAVQVTYFHT